jgi:phage shock protein PspC (stress-responsive transcriptional regulator)
MAFIAKLAADKSAGIVTGVLHGKPVSPGVREGMLFGMWLPWQALVVGIAAFLTLTQLEMANHLTDANVRVLAYLFAFFSSVAGTFALVISAIALPGYRAKVRRDAQRQAEAD